MYTHNIIGQEDSRLVDGKYGAHMGRLELLYNGTWGTVCAPYWSMYESMVACRYILNSPSFFLWGGRENLYSLRGSILHPLCQVGAILPTWCMWAIFIPHDQWDLLYNCALVAYTHVHVPHSKLSGRCSLITLYGTCNMFACINYYQW